MKEFDVVGLDAAYRMLDGLPLQMKANALNSAHRNVMNKYIIKPAKQYKPDYKKAWKISSSRSDKLAILGGARKGITDDGKFHQMLRWEEYGITERKHKDGTSTGTYAIKKPFFRSLVARSIKPMIKDLNANYGKLIGAYLKKVSERNDKKLRG